MDLDGADAQLVEVLEQLADLRGRALLLHEHDRGLDAGVQVISLQELVLQVTWTSRHCN